MGTGVTHYKIREEVHCIPDKTLPWSHKCLYGRLCLRCNHKNRSWWSNEKMAKDMQIEKRTLQKWCRQLERLGLIEIDRSKNRTNNVSITEPTDEKWRELGVPQGVLDKLRGVPPDTGGCPTGHGGDVRLDTPSRKLKEKTKREKDGCAVGRSTVDNELEDADVLAAGRRAVEKAKKRREHTVPSPESRPLLDEQMWGIQAEPAEPDEAQLSGWSTKVWSKHFVSRMNRAGYDVAFQKYKATVPTHIGAIRDHLLNRGFSRLKIYRFLLEWFPEIYPDICESMFKKRSDDQMFSVSWMETKLDELVRLYEDKDVSSSFDDKITFTD